jgi:hypothetical protein
VNWVLLELELVLMMPVLKTHLVLVLEDYLIRICYSSEEKTLKRNVKKYELHIARIIGESPEQAKESAAKF